MVVGKGLLCSFEQIQKIPKRPFCHQKQPVFCFLKISHLGTSVPNLYIFVVRKMPSPRVIVVRAGTYYLSKTIELGTSDSGLTIQAYENEKPIISGAMLLMNISWKEYKTSGDMNIWSADLSSQGGLLS